MSPIIQTFPIAAAQWPTADPFLFLAHHLDAYPAAAGDTAGPDPAELAGRDLGMDFHGRDGWNMYHGTVVPGFPQHPHQGFETITVVEEGIVDHTDSEGAVARYGQGDTQWLTAGAGVAHAEMFPLLDPDAPNPLHLFQIWLNLAPEDKRTPANFQMFWAEDTPVVERRDAAGRRARVKVVAGVFDGVQPLTPPPGSWAARPDADVAVWHATLDADARLVLPRAAEGTTRVVYAYDGPLEVAGRTLDVQGAVVDPTADVEVAAGPRGARFLLLQGRPIGAPVVQQGPFVANSRAELAQAFDDYRAGRFGRWPHATDDPVQPREQGRFARYPDGRISTPAG
jgi:redox-sensitive bicupin YhaK (pirin superfamily)